MRLTDQTIRGYSSLLSASETTPTLLFRACPYASERGRKRSCMSVARGQTGRATRSADTTRRGSRWRLRARRRGTSLLRSASHRGLECNRRRIGRRCEPFSGPTALKGTERRPDEKSSVTTSVISCRRSATFGCLTSRPAISSPSSIESSIRLQRPITPSSMRARSSAGRLSAASLNAHQWKGSTDPPQRFPARASSPRMNLWPRGKPAGTSRILVRMFEPSSSPASAAGRFLTFERT